MAIYVRNIHLRIDSKYIYYKGLAKICCCDMKAWWNLGGKMKFDAQTICEVWAKSAPKMKELRVGVLG